MRDEGTLGDAKSENARTSILMIGMSTTRTRGGISTLISDILASNLRDRFEIEFIESQAEDLRGLRKLTLAIAASAKTIARLVFNRPALVYIHVGSNASLYREPLFALIARVFGVPSVAHFHAGDVDEYLAAQPYAGRRFVSFALGVARRLIAVSDDSAAKLARLVPNGDIVTIQNAIDASTLDFPMERFSIRSGPARILFVGAMGKLKGECDLADAIAKIAESRDDFRVSFLGFGGEDFSRYCDEKGVSRFIEFLGPVSQADRAAHFERADIFCLPTHAEAMPMSVIEAMAAGLAVVSTPVGGIPELIANEREGLLIQPGDVAALASRIDELLADRAKRLELGRAAREKAGRFTDFDVYSKKLGETLATVIAESKRENRPRAGVVSRERLGNE